MFGTFQNAETNLNGTLFLYPVRVYPIGTRIGDDFMKIGYIRVSTDEQNTIRQEILMKELGVVLYWTPTMEVKQWYFTNCNLI